MKKNLFFILLFSALSFFVAPLHLTCALNEGEDVEEVRLLMNEPKIIPVSNPTRIVIANPNIADVSGVTTSEFTLSPKAVGTTRLVFWDNFGEQAFRVMVLSEDLVLVKRRVDNLIKQLDYAEVYTQMSETEGKVLLMGRVKTAQERERLLNAVGTLKDKLTDLLLIKEEDGLIEIDVEILELNESGSKTLGFTWPSQVEIYEAATSLANVATAGGTTWGKLFKIGNVARQHAMTLTIDALLSEGKARLLSRPRLTCQSGKEAQLLVGGEKPIMTTNVTEQGATTTNVEYKEYGLKFKIKPTLTDNNDIKLALNVDISDLGQAEILGTAAAVTARAYPLIKRTTSTEVFLKDGEMMAISGLIRQKREETINKVPFLGNLPLVGGFFRQSSTLDGGDLERGNIELVIILTPHIVALKGVPIPEKGSRVSQSAPAQNAKELSRVKENLGLKEYMSAMEYTSLVQKKILGSLEYPASAKEAGFQGIVQLRMHLTYLGELLDTDIKSSSGYKVLDDNALLVAKQITYYPPFPASILEKDLWIDIPVVYRLD